MKRLTNWILAAVCLALSAPMTLAGEAVKDFTLPDVHGRERSLAEFAEQPYVVLAFLGTECPLARLYAPRLQELSEEFAARGVAFVAIDANEQDSLAEMSAFAQRYGLKVPLLKDREGALADELGAVRNPEVFVLDRERRVRYRGRIDDQYGLGASSGYARPEIKTRHLAEALEELLAGKEVSTPETSALGCVIGRKPKTAPHGEITYTKHIAGLLQNHCVRCHRPGEVGPFALQDYDEVVGWAEMIREVVSDGRMPPWSANPEYGHFKNDARLSDDEKRTLNAWIDNGCPEGDPSDLPAPVQFTDGWQIPEPDEVHRMPKPFKVPAEGVVNYQHIVVDPGWTEDKWIQAAEVRPTNRSVVHHIIVFVLPPGGLRAMLAESDEGDSASGERIRELRREALAGRGRLGGGAGLGRGAGRDGIGSALESRGGGLTAYVPGSVATIHQPGVATFVKAGSRLIFQMHYTPNGTPQEDQSYVGVVFADPKSVKKRMHGGAAAQRRLAIPPGDDNYVVTSERTFNTDQLLMYMSPHMHLRGKSFRYEAHYPDGTTEILLDVPKYDFNWQLRYELAEPKLMPAGTVLRCTASYDNSEDNLANPDPGKTVRWGPQTWDEMMIGFHGTISVEDDAHVASSN